MNVEVVFWMFSDASAVVAKVPTGEKIDLLLDT